MSDAGAERPRGLRLFHKLFLTTLVIGLVPLLGLAAAMLDTNSEALKDNNRHLMISVAANVAREVRHQLKFASSELLGVGQILLGPGDADDQQRLALAGSRVTGSSALDYAGIYDPRGRLVVAVKAQDRSAPDFAQQLDGALLQRFKGAELLAGEVFAGPVGPLLPIYLPIVVDGERRGIIGSAIDLRPLCELTKTLGERSFSKLDGVAVVDPVMVIDQARTLVAAADPARVAKHESQQGHGIFAAQVGSLGFRGDLGASLEFETEKGEGMLGAVEPLAELGWAVIVQQPQELAYHSVYVMRRSVLYAALAAALGAALAGFFLARRLARPIARLAEETRKIGERSFTTVPADLSGRADELGSLGRAFDEMSATLRESEKLLVIETRASTSLSRYLSRDVVDAILKDPERLRLGGERREITVLFADVVAFTKLAEQQQPEVVVQILNELFTFATEIIQRRGGIIDKFIGDCVMAVWGAPEQHADDPLRAVLAAEDLRRWLDTANRHWRKQLGLEIRLAMGINTGQAVAGNLGSEKRMDYTVIGDAVNVAARLEAKAAPGQILISQATRDRLPKEFEPGRLKPLGESKLYGKEATLPIFEVAE